MEKLNWEYLGYNRDGGGYKCNLCGAVFSLYATIPMDGKCPECGCSRMKEKNISDYNIDALKNLANEIIKGNAERYRYLLREVMCRRGNAKNNIGKILELEILRRWFLSNEYRYLTKLDPYAILDPIEREYKNFGVNKLFDKNGYFLGGKNGRK